MATRPRTPRGSTSSRNEAMTKARRRQLLERLAKRSTSTDGFDRAALRRILHERESLTPDDG